MYFYTIFPIVCSDDGTCKHIVALLFSCVEFVTRHSDRHIAVGTDLQCKWDHTRQESKPMRITDLDVRRTTDMPKIEPTTLQYIPLKIKDSREEINDQVYRLLKEHAPNSGALLYMNPPSGYTQTDAGPVYLTDMAMAYKNMNGLDVIPDIALFLNYLEQQLTSETISRIASLSQGSGEWYKHRQGRLTGSMMGRVWGFRMSNEQNNSLVRDVLNQNQTTWRGPSISYGIDFEPVARTLYLVEKQKEQHKKLTIRATGLVIDHTMPILGASPDGLVTCACHGNSIIEIKCCHSRRDESPQDIAESGDYHVYVDAAGSYCLKKTSPWYHQMIAEMAVTGSSCGELVLFTNKGIIYFTIPFSEEHWQNLKDKCVQVYKKFILPLL